MTEKRTHFFVGLFVMTGIAMAVAAIIWVGASKYFERGAKYVTYFDESVQGLQVDSIVKYRGVDIGRVEKIRVAPDERLVEVVMKLDVADFSVEGVVAKLSMAGITGIVYVEFDQKRLRDQVKPPRLSFKPPYPVIPSYPSEITQIGASIRDILAGLQQLDLKGLFSELSRTVKSIDGFVSGEKLKTTMADISLAAARLASLTKKADNMLSHDGAVEGVLVGVKKTIEEARTTLSTIRGEIEAMKMGQLAGKVSKAVDGTSRKVQSAAVQVEITAETLRRTSESLEALVERLKADPSQLIFSSTPLPKGE